MDMENSVVIAGVGSIRGLIGNGKKNKVKLKSKIKAQEDNKRFS